MGDFESESWGPSGVSKDRQPEQEATTPDMPAVEWDADTKLGYRLHVMSVERLKELHDQFCPPRLINQLAARTDLTPEEKDVLSAQATEVNRSGIHVFACPIKGCTAVESLRFEDRRVIITRDDTSECAISAAIRRRNAQQD